MTADHIRVGKMGEQAVTNHLMQKGYVLRGTNYQKKWGEIDVIMEKDGVVHFIEVKTVSCGTLKRGKIVDAWLPEENVQRHKLQKLLRTIETWLLEHEYEGDWQLDVAAVHINREERRGVVKMLENVGADL